MYNRGVQQAQPIWSRLKGHLTGTKLRKQLVVSTAGTLALFFSSKVLMLVASILLARLIGAREYGVYATCNALLLMLNAPATLGLAVLVVRMAAHYRATSEWPLVRGLLLRSNQAVFAASILVSACGTVWLFYADHSLHPVETGAFGWALAALPFVALGTIRLAALRGLGHVALGQLPESFVMPVTFVLALVAWHMVGWPANGSTAMELRFGATFIAFVVGSILLARCIPAAVRNVKPIFQTGSWARSIPPLLLLSAMLMAASQIDVLLLAAFQGAKSAGIYQTASRGAELVAFSLTIVNFALQPTLSALYANKDRARLQRLITYCARATFATTIIGAAFIAAISGTLMSVAFGEEFRRGATCLALLAMGQALSSGVGSPDQILNMTGHEKDVAFMTGVGTVLNLAFNLVLIPAWDIEGAAIGTMSSMIITKMMLAHRVRTRLGLGATILS
jgi:O-antigen/teichoic acid export membrane protein